MANQILIPKLNPLQWVEESPGIIAQFKSKHMDDFWFSEQRRDFETKVDFKQRWLTVDSIPQQYESNFDPIQIDIINCSKQVVLSFNATKKSANIYQPGFYAYEVNMSLASLPQGTYFAVMTLGGSGTKAITEPFEVIRNSETALKNSLLFQYTDSKHHGDVLFQTGIQFNFRLDNAMITRLDPRSNTTRWRDQEESPRTLKSRPFRTWDLVMSFRDGMPDWVIEKLNWIFSCETVKIDGKLYTAFEEGDFEEIEIDSSYPMRTWKLVIQEGINRASKIIAPTLNTDIKLVVGYNINTKLFGDTSENAGSNLVPIEGTE